MSSTNMTSVDLGKSEKGIMKNVCGTEMAMSNLKVENSGWELLVMPMYVPLTGIMRHRKEESHLHTSSPVLLGLLGSTSIVVIDVTVRPVMMETMN